LPIITELKKNKNILVCPLDWGLGHATRMVPVIEMLNKFEVNVIIAADNGPLDFLSQRFPDNKCIKLSGFSPSYPTNSNMALLMLKAFPEMLKAARRAKSDLNDIITKHDINAVISDNRYELSTSKVPTVFITHQLNIQTKGWQKIGKPLIDFIINKYIGRFNEIWIPDVISGFKLSGELSYSNKFNHNSFNIGLLSRFSELTIKSNNKYIDLLIILSGPEPQRTILEKLLLKQVLKTNLKTVILLAKPGKYFEIKKKNIQMYSHLPDHEFAGLLKSAKIVISRPGYSTLMDLALFDKSAIFIPTPGQTEQEYLANRLLTRKIAFCQSQEKFDLSTAIEKQRGFKGLSLKNESKLLKSRVEHLLNIC